MFSIAAEVPAIFGEVASFLAGGAVGAALTRVARARNSSGNGGSRMRTGRLPLPASVASLTADDVPALDRVNAFVDRLAELPARAWIEIGRARMSTPADDRHGIAFALLEATIGAHEMGVTAWYVRDAVETAAFLAASAMPRWTREERRAFVAAQGAAEDAALALLARSYLAQADFDLLFASFGAEQLTASAN